MILRLFEFFMAIGVVYFLLTQIVMPGLSGGKLFPFFVKDPLKNTVAKTADQVATLRDQVDATEQLVQLQDQKTKLEHKLEASAPSDLTK